MEKLKLFGISVIVLILIFCAFYFGVNKNPYSMEEIIREVTENTRLIDANTDHNQALEVAEYAKNKGLDIPPILINFDTHSDIYTNFPVLKYNSVGVENWINTYLAKYPQVKELYWVMPKEEALNISLRMFFAESDYRFITMGSGLYGNSLDKNLNPYKFVFTPLTHKMYSQNFIIDTKTGTLNEYIKGNKINKILFRKGRNYKKIKIITCTEDTLPDFSGKRVFLSIDADYISNSGFDTVDDFNIFKFSKGIDAGFYSIFKTLKDKNVRPEIISMSLSPQYLPIEHHSHVSKIFQYIIKASNLTDEIYQYKRYYADSPNYLRGLYEKLYVNKLLF